MLGEREQKWVDRVKAECAHIPLLPLDELRALPEAKEFDSGVYFLWNAGELQYIGKSIQVMTRICNHSFSTRRGGTDTTYHSRVPFDRHTCLVLENGRYRVPGVEKRLTEHEQAYIAHYLPPHNLIGDMP
jgi:hypothetical protein